MKTKTNHEPEQTIHDRQALALTVANEIRRVPYSKRAQPSVIDVMELHKALKNAESDCDRRKRELGKARIGEALGKWTVLSGRSTLSFGTNTVPDIVHEHPKIDHDVSQWLGIPIKYGTPFPASRVPGCTLRLMANATWIEFPRRWYFLRDASEIVNNQRFSGNSVEDSGVKALERKVGDLKITNQAKDYYIDRLERERGDFIEKLMTSSHRVGDLEAKLLQLEAPQKERTPKTDHPVKEPAVQ